MNRVPYLLRGFLLAVLGLIAHVDAASARPARPAPALPAPSSAVVTVTTEAQLQTAVAGLVSNTTIVIAPGTYRLSSTLWVGNRTLTNVGIRGATANSDDVVLVGPGMTNPSYGAVPFGVWTGNGVTGVTIANLTLRDFYFNGIILNGGTQTPLIHNVHVIDTGEQLIKSNPDGAGGGVNNGVLEYSILEFTTTARDDYPKGIDMHTASGWIIRHNRFRNIVGPGGIMAGPGILAWNGSSGTIAEGNLFLNCSRGIMFGGDDQPGFSHSGGIIRNNIVYRSSAQPGDGGIIVWDSPNTQVVNNTVLLSGTYSGSIEYRFPQATNILIANNLYDTQILQRDGASATLANNVGGATASMFVDVANADFHLSSLATTAIGHGTPVAAVIDDWDGDPRVIPVDVGADERLVTPPSTLPMPWANQDVGNVGAAGSAGASGGLFTVAGSGNDIWGTADAFQFVYQAWTGDGQIVARVATQQNTNVWAEAGVMMRESLAPGARHASLLVTPTSGLAFEQRATTNGLTTYTAGSGAAPQWVRLVRSGATISAAQSSDGMTWTPLGSVTLSMGATVYVGLVANSHVPGALSTATFDHVSLASVAVTNPASGAVITPGTTVTVSATASSTAGIQQVQFFVNGASIGSVAASPYAVAWGPIAAGSYTVTAVATDGGGTTATASVAVTATAAGTLPAGWTSQDIGSVGAAGSAGASGGLFTVAGSGNDIWGTADAFQFVYQAWTGDGQIVARVATQQNTNVWAEAGVMMRESLAPGSRHASLLVTPTSGLAFEQRATTNGLTTYTAGSGAAPQWVRLVRSGATISAAQSSDGVTWTPLGSVTLPMPATLYIGIVANSHVPGTLSTATFDNVSLASWTSQDVGNVGAAGSAGASGGLFTVAGSGNDIWGTADAFQFVYQAWTGDGQIVARVATQQNTNVWAEAGVMMRESLAPGSRHASLLVTPTSGLAFEQRATTNGLTTYTAGSGAAPQWVRLVRSGATISAAQSSDGVSWTPLGSVTLSMGATVYVGLVANSHVPGTLSTATFDHVTLNGGE